MKDRDPPAHKRRRKLVEPRLQLIFGFHVLAAAFVSVLVQMLVIRYLLGELATGLPNDGELLREELPTRLVGSFLVTFALLAPLSMAVAVHSLVKLVGPLGRFRTFLESVKRGESPAPCVIRKTDELHHLCDLLNEATLPLRCADAPALDPIPAPEVQATEVGHWHIRSRRLPEPRLQMRFCAIFLAIAVATVVADVLVLNHLLNDLAGSLPNDGEALRASIPNLLPASFLLTLMLLVPITLALGIRVTFRIVGPLRRFREFLEEVVRGARPALCRIRRSDELQDFCVLLNEVTAPLRAAGEPRRQGSSRAA